jgi:ADP-heptose:LPS heptosyltransferase
MEIKIGMNLLLADGGMGDLVGQLVAVDHCIKHHSHVTFHTYVPDYMLEYAKHVLLRGSIVNPYSLKSKWRADFHGRTTAWRTDHSCMRTHPVDYGFHMLADRHIYRLKDKNYLQIRPNEIKIGKFFLPEKYVCIVTTASEPVKQMPVETINAVIGYVLRLGYIPVFLGKEISEAGYNKLAIKAKIIPIDYSKGINLVNKTTMLEAAAVIAGSACLVGMDGGLVHVAGSTDAHIIAGYTLVDPIHIAPIRHGGQSYRFIAIEPDLNVPNRYYQTYFSGFREGDHRVFPQWEQSVASMTADKFIDALRRVLPCQTECLDPASLGNSRPYLAFEESYPLQTDLS